MGRTRIKVKIKDTDKGWKALSRQIAESRREAVTVGVHGDESGRDAEGMNNVRLMGIHEFGRRSVGIPSRSVIRLTVDQNTKRYKLALRRIGGRIYAQGMPVWAGLRVVGELVSSDMKRTFRRQPKEWAPLKPATIAAKGSSKTLIDTRELLKSFNYKIVPR